MSERIRIAFPCLNMSTGGGISFVYNQVKHMEKARYDIYVYEAEEAHVDHIKSNLLALDDITYRQVAKDSFLNQVKEDSIQLIHYNHWYSEPRAGEIPSVQTIHSPFDEAEVLGHADIYLAISKWQLDVYHDYHPRFIQTFIDNHLFDRSCYSDKRVIRKELGLPTDKRIVLAMGTVAPYKNHEKIQELWHDINAILVVVGPLADNFKSYWEKFVGKNPDVLYTDGTSRPELYMAAADLFINCSIAEGCSLANLEASSMRLPLVVSDIRANRDVYEETGAAIISQVDESFIEAVEQILSDKAIAYEMGLVGRKMVEENYSVERYLGEMEDIYTDLLSGEAEKTLVKPLSLPDSEYQPEVEVEVNYSEGGVKTYYKVDKPVGELLIQVTNDVDGSPIDKALVYPEPGVRYWRKSFGKKWYVRYKIQIFQNDHLVFEEVMNLKDKTVFIDMATGALGDTIAWMPAAIDFQKLHGCNLYVRTNYIDLFRHLEDDYFHLIEDRSLIPSCDVTYQIGAFDDSSFHKFGDWRSIPLQQTATDMLGLSYEGDRFIDLSVLAGERPISEKYVCIAPISTMMMKQWNYPGGWQILANKLLEEGYQVVWISKEPCNLRQVIDMSGTRPLEERITYLEHCEFFVGLPSGLSWLARSTGAYCFMITGAFPDWLEFQEHVTRIRQAGVCNNCSSKPYPWVPKDDYCPENKGFECTRYLSPELVLDAIQDWLSGRTFKDIEPIDPDFMSYALTIRNTLSGSTRIHAAFYYWLVQELDAQSVLEIGLWRGYTFIHLARAVMKTGGRIIGIDSFSDENLHASSKVMVERNLRLNGVSGGFEIIDGNSHLVLKELFHQGYTFDFIHIDGDHAYESAREDFLDSLKMLSPGGIIAMHDTVTDIGVLQLIDEIKDSDKYHVVDFPIDCGIALIKPREGYAHCSDSSGTD